MLLCDVNVLIYAARHDVAGHARYAEWLSRVVNGDETYGVSDGVLSSFLRIVTNPRAFREPSPLAEALDFCDRLREARIASSSGPGCGIGRSSSSYASG